MEISLLPLHIIYHGPNESSAKAHRMRWGLVRGWKAALGAESLDLFKTCFEITSIRCPSDAQHFAYKERLISSTINEQSMDYFHENAISISSRSERSSGTTSGDLQSRQWSFPNWLISWFAGQSLKIIKYAGGGEEPSFQNPTSRNTSSTTTSHTSQSSGSKRTDDGTDGSSMDGDDGRRLKRPRKKSLPPREQSVFRRFACPFRKHDPAKYSSLDHQWRVCASGPGFQDLARLKEHLYRKHVAPKYCKRCWQQFDGDKEFDRHMYDTDRCESKEGKPPEGITEDTIRRLRKRSQNGSEAEKWCEIYLLLFPNSQDIPSPYFEEAGPTHLDSRTLVEFQEYLQRVVPRVFRSALENSLDNEMQPLEEHQMSQITSILRESQDQAFSLYRTQMASTPGTPMTSISTDEFSAPSSTLLGGRQMEESSYSTTTEEGSIVWGTSPHCHVDNILGANLDANSVSTQGPTSHEEVLYSWPVPEFVESNDFFPFDGPDTHGHINTLGFQQF